MTNGERIRQMTDEELLDLLDGVICFIIDYCRLPDIECRDCIMNWLKQEVKDDE